MSYEITLTMDGIPGEISPSTLEHYGIRLNNYAHLFMNHPAFQRTTTPQPVSLMILSVEELGFPDGAAFPKILDAARKRGLYPCAPATGAYLRLNMRNQEISKNAVLTGTQDAPEGAITIVSHRLEQSIEFPRGLYLRNVSGTLWLRGYICDDEYRWKPSDVLAFEIK